MLSKEYSQFMIADWNILFPNSIIASVTIYSFRSDIQIESMLTITIRRIHEQNNKMRGEIKDI